LRSGALTVTASAPATAELPTLPQQPAQRGLYAWFVLAMLVAVYICSWFDRYLMVISMDSIRLELGISDTQLGLLTGVAYSLVYACAGLFVARWSDLSSRKRIIAGGLALWCLLSMACAAVGNFLQLALVRFGAGAAESSAGPASHSLISDYFGPERRATALAIHSVGLYVGVGLGLGIGSWLLANHGWRHSFLLAGIPGLVLAVIFLIGVREPPRQHAARLPQADHAAHPSLTALLREVALRRSFVAYTIGVGLLVYASSAVDTWGAMFLMRVHGIDTVEVGAHFAVLAPTAGIIGTLLFSALADRLARRDPRWYLWIAGGGALCAGPFILAFLYAPRDWVFVCYAAEVFFSASFMAPVIAVSQRLMPPRTRALSSALILLSFNIIGSTFGNLATGMLSDLMTSLLGPTGIRTALSFNVSGSIIGVALIFIGARWLHADLARLETPPAAA